MNIELYKENNDIIKSTGRIPLNIMPQSIEESLNLLSSYPKEFYTSLKPRNEIDCINSCICTLGQFKRATDDEAGLNLVVRALVVLIITDTISFFNIGSRMSDEQIAQTADMIIDNYCFLKIDDFKLCFNNAKKGNYGKIFCVDGNVILTWIEKYVENRLRAGEEDSYNKHNAAKNSDKDGQSFLEIIQQHRSKI